MVQPKKGLGQVPKNQINERVPLMRAKNREERGRGCSPLTVELRVALVGPIGAAVFHLNGATSKGRALPARKTPLPADLSEALRSGELVALRRGAALVRAGRRLEGRAVVAVGREKVLDDRRAAVLFTLHAHNYVSVTNDG